jgi:cytidine deaminase
MNADLQTLANELRKKAFPDEYVQETHDLDWFNQVLGHQDFDPEVDLRNIIFSPASNEPGALNDPAIYAEEFKSEITRLIIGATYASYQGVNYRRFNVGCRGFYVDTATNKIALLSSSNLKQHELAKKRCAELANLELAQELGFDYCVGLVVVSLKGQLDPLSGKKAEFQPPCGNCRLEFATNPMVKDSSFIYCANGLKKGKPKLFVKNELLDQYGVPII